MATDPNYVPVNDLMEYEAGGQTMEQTEAMFQKLVNSGLAWRLQGHYGRAAMALIEAGLIEPPKETQ